MKLGFALLLAACAYGATTGASLAFFGVTGTPKPLTDSCLKRHSLAGASLPVAPSQIASMFPRSARRYPLWAAASAEAEAEDGVEGEGEEREETAAELTPEEKAKQEIKDEIKALESELVGLRNKLSDGQDRLKTVGKEGYMRLAAEVDTYKRRRGDALNYVRDEAVRESLGQMVTPWEAIEELEARFAGVTDESQLKIINGFHGLGRGFITKLEKLGLKTIVPEVGERYDPGKHMVEERVLGGAEEDDIILSVSSRGYEVSGRVVRPAEVKISVTEATLASETAKDAAAAEEEAEEEFDAEDS